MKPYLILVRIPSKIERNLLNIYLFWSNAVQKNNIFHSQYTFPPSRTGFDVYRAWKEEGEGLGFAIS